MSELKNDLRTEFHDSDFRHIYADESLNTYVATQIKVLREQRGWTQKRLAQEAGMAQPRIAVMEDINYSAWSLSTLRRLAHAFDLRLSVRFESFSSLIPEVEGFNRESLQRPSFADDRWFHETDAKLADTATTNKVPYYLKTLTGLQLGLKFSSIATMQVAVSEGGKTPANLYVMPNRVVGGSYYASKTEPVRITASR